MSSMDQAFVKAFARRNQSGRNQSGGNQPGGNQVGPAPAASPLDELGLLKVDRSVAGTAEIWVDPIEDQIARADIAEFDVPKPHLEPQVESDSSQPPAVIESLQHIHTAYATGFADAPLASAELASASASTDFVGSASVLPPTNPQAPATSQPARPPAAVDVAEVRIDTADAQSHSPHTVTPFKAVWEVDVFDVPSSVADLFFEGTLFQQIAERMSGADPYVHMQRTSTKAHRDRCTCTQRVGLLFINIMNLNLKTALLDLLKSDCKRQSNAGMLIATGLCSQTNRSEVAVS